MSLLLACASTPADKQVRPPLSYQDQIRQGAIVAADQPELVLRYNPVACSCPPFEVQVGSRWVRVQLEDGDEGTNPAAALAQKGKADLEQDKMVHYKVKGELDTSLNRCAQDAIYLVLSLEGSP